MCENLIQELKKVEINSESIEKRILELRNIINKKVDYKDQIKEIESLIEYIE